MKRFLPLFILTSFLFGQDVLLLKSGKNYKGRFITKENEVIIFRLEGEKDSRMFLINDVDIIIANREGAKVELYYPFDMPIIKESPSFGKDVLYLKSGEFKKGKCDGKVGSYIIFQIDGKNKKYRLEKVESIEIDNKNYYYPFNLPITSTYKYQGLSPTTKSKLYPLAGTCVGIIWLYINYFLESS